MNRRQVLAQYDAEIRRDPPLSEGSSIERADGLVLEIGEHPWISFSHLASDSAPNVVAEVTDRFRRSRSEVEWKVYGHDPLAELPRLLAECGFVAEPPETLMALDLSEGTIDPRTLPGIRFERVTDETDLRTAVGVSSLAFAPDAGWSLREYLKRLRDPALVVMLARAGETPVGVGRLELPPERSFASLWGGGTVPEYRGRGLYRSMVSARAEIARARGYRYLTVDARATSRPILERIGFEPLTSIVGWVLHP